MTLEKPYFLTNEEWFIHDEEQWKYILTDKATKEAKESYKEFYEQLENSHFEEIELK
ncbi:MAG: hypothetical protein ACRC6U_06500 [Fusobacteriaceae bacterium]